MSTKVVTGKVRLSFVHLFEPVSFEGSDPKYSVMLLIPKSDKVTIQKIKKAQQAAAEAGKDKFKGGVVPKTLKSTLRDGDEEKDTVEFPEFAGHYFMSVSSKNKPGVVDRDTDPILDQSEIYSGCYARASLNFFAYSVKGNQGTAAGLNNLQKLADGEPLGGSASRAEDDFADEFEDDDDDLLA